MNCFIWLNKTITLSKPNQASQKMSNSSTYVLPEWPSNFQGFQGLIPVPIEIHQVPVEIQHVPVEIQHVSDQVPNEIVQVQAQQDEPTELIYALAKSLKLLKKGKDIILPVKKLLNIGVEISIYKQTKQMYRINIEPTDFEVEDNVLFEGTYDRELTKETTEDDFIQNMMRCLLLNLKTIKINKMNGRFCTNKKQEHLEKMDELWVMFCEEFKDVETVTLALEECCVCYTFTKTMTNCDHSVCLDCISKIRDETSVDEEVNIHDDYKNCPMCRQRITHLHYK